MSLVYVGGDLGHTGFGTVTRDLIAGLVELGTDVRLLTFDDVVPKDLPQWLTDRLVLIPRLGFWMTVDETRGAEEPMRERIAPKFTPGRYTDGSAPDCLLGLGDPAAAGRFGPVAIL